MPGKTTLIKKLLTDKAFGDEKVVLVENEFGEIGIDGKTLLMKQELKFMKWTLGDICCSLVGDFKTAVQAGCRRLSSGQSNYRAIRCW